jgi:hypothetical protein
VTWTRSELTGTGWKCRSLSSVPEDKDETDLNWPSDASIIPDRSSSLALQWPPDGLSEAPPARDPAIALDVRATMAWRSSSAAQVKSLGARVKYVSRSLGWSVEGSHGGLKWPLHNETCILRDPWHQQGLAGETAKVEIAQAPAGCSPRR